MEPETLPARIVPQTSDVAQICAVDLVEAWLSGRKASTIEGYRRDLDHFTRFFRNTLEVFFECGPGQANGVVLAYRAHQLEQGLSSATISRRLAAIRSFVKLARTLGRINWSIEVEAPKHEDRRDMSGPDDAARKKIMKTLKTLGDDAKARRTRAMYSLLFGMALRRDEVCSLDLADVDFVTGKLTVLRKGRREKTTRPIPPNTLQTLGQWVEARGRHDGPLFLRTDRKSNERLSGEVVWREMVALGKQAGLTSTLRPHGLRHAGITLLLDRGETERNVAAFSGHADTKTLRRYDDTKTKATGRLSNQVDSEMR